MKRIKKVLVFALLACMLLSLTGCVDVQELRDGRAYYNDDTHLTVHFRNQDYTMYTGSIDYEINAELVGCIAEKDVPLLLAEMLGGTMYYNDACTILAVDNVYETVYYIRNDYISTFTSILTDAAFTDYCYYTYDEEDYDYTLVTASAEVSDAITKTISGEPLRDFDDESVWYVSQLYRCDSTITLLDPAFELYEDGYGNYYLSAHYGTYAVPEDCKSAIAQISQDYYDYEDTLYYEDEYYDDLYI